MRKAAYLAYAAVQIINHVSPRKIVSNYMRSIKKLIVPSKIVGREIHVTSPIANTF